MSAERARLAHAGSWRLTCIECTHPREGQAVIALVQQEAREHADGVGPDPRPRLEVDMLHEDVHAAVEHRISTLSD